MRQYLATLHKRSHSHKKRFALLTSGGFTLIIFAVWTLVNFGGNASTPASVNSAVKEVSPFGSFVNKVDESFEGLKGGLNNSFNDLKEDTLNTYGR